MANKKNNTNILSDLMGKELYKSPFNYRYLNIHPDFSGIQNNSEKPKETIIDYYHTNKFRTHKIAKPLSKILVIKQH